MKKIFTILCLMALALGAQAAAPYKGIQLTFDKYGSGNASPSNVAVVVKDMDGNAIDGVTATLTATNMAAFKTGSAAALSRNENFAIVPSAANDGYSNQQDGTIEYTFQITGLRSGFTYTNAALDVYACNGQGTSQPNTGTTIRYFTFDVSTGSSATDLTPFVSQANNDICTVPDQDGGLYHKLWNMNANEVKTATETLYIKVVLTKTSPNNEGCFAGLGKVQLYDDTPETVTEYDAIRLTFNQDGTGNASPGNVTMSVKTLSGDLISGVSAELVETSFNQFQSGKVPSGTAATKEALTRANGFALIPRNDNAAGSGSNYANNNGATVVYTIKVSGLPSTFVYNTSGLDVYTTTANGTSDQGTTQAKSFSFDVKTGSSTDDLTDFASMGLTDIITASGTSVDGGLYHKLWNMKSSTTASGTDELYIRVTITKGNEGGCFVGLGAIELSTSINVTYKLMENNVEVKSVVVAQEKNSEVSVPTELTSGYYASAYTFPTSGTIGTEDCTITVTATPNTGVVTDLANLSNDKVYTLVTRRGALSTDGSAVTTNTAGDRPNFGIVKYVKNGEENLYLWSVNDSKWVKNDGTLTANVADIATSSKLVVTATNVRNNLKPLFFMGVGNNGLNTNAGGHCAVNSYTTRDDGNEFLITEVADADGTAYAALEAYFDPSHTITYVVKDVNDNELLRETLPSELGAEISELPDALKRAYTSYTYPDGSVTITGNSHTFNAVATFDLPFETFTSFENAKWYNVNIRNTKYMAYANADKYPNAAATWTQKSSDEYQWAFKGNPYDGIQVYNKAIGASKTLKLTGTSNKAAITMQDGEYGWVIAAGSGYAAGGFILYDGATGFLHDHAEGLSVWNSTAALSDAGSRLFVQEAPLAEANYFIADLANLSNDKVYTVHNTPRAMWTFTTTSMGADPLTGIDIIAEANNPAAKHQIAIVKQNDKYYLYSVEQGKYLASNNKLYLSPIEAVSITESSYTEKGPEYKWFFNFEGYTDRNINTNGSPAIEINYWNTKDYGNTNAIMETTATYDKNAALAAFNDYTQCITDYCDLKGIGTDFASHIGELGYPKAGTAATTAFTEILDRNASDENTAEDWNTLKAKYSALVAPENIVLPEVGKFYRVKGVVSGRYMQSNACTTASNENTQRVGVRLGATETADASTIFYLDTDNKLLGYSNGLYVTNTCDINAVDGNLTNATEYTFAPRNGNGEFAVKNGDTFLYSWSGDENICFDRQGSDADACRMTIEPVNELPITLKEVGGKYYATFSAPVDIASITGADAFNVEVSDDNKMASTKPIDGDGLKAGNGVVLIGTTNKATATIGAAAATATTNLKPQYASEPAATHNDAGHFFLGTKQNNEGTPVIGFYKLKSDGGKTGGFKAYIEKNPAQSSAPAVEGFMLVFDGGVTGIENMEHGAFDNGAVYNLQGQRVTKATKGVFIQNGKKVVLK